MRSGHARNVGRMTVRACPLANPAASAPAHRAIPALRRPTSSRQPRVSAQFLQSPRTQRHSQSWHRWRLSPGAGMGANHGLFPLYAARGRPHGGTDAAHDPKSGAAPPAAHPLSIRPAQWAAQTPDRRPAAAPASTHAHGGESVDGAAGAGAHRPGGRAVREHLSSDRLSGGQAARVIPARQSPWRATSHRRKPALHSSTSAKPPPGQTAPRCQPRHRRNCRLRRHRFPIGSASSRRTVRAAISGSTS